MVKWKYLSYRDQPNDSGQDLVRPFFEGLPPGVRGAIASEMNTRSVQEKALWLEVKYCKELKRPYVGVAELRFRFTDKNGNKEVYRILGYMDETAKEFTMLSGFEKDDFAVDYYG